MSEIKQGDVVLHKATGSKGVVMRRWTTAGVSGQPGDEMVMVDSGDGRGVPYPLTSVSLASSPDIVRRLEALEKRVDDIERGQQLRRAAGF